MSEGNLEAAAYNMLATLDALKDVPDSAPLRCAKEWLRMAVEGGDRIPMMPCAVTPDDDRGAAFAS